MIGYDSITPQPPLVKAAVPPANPTRHFQHELRNILVDQGFTEVYNYSFLSEESVAAFGFDAAAHLRVTNPIASDQALMRLSLLPGIWRNVLENAKHRENFRVFEIGLEIQGAPAGSELPQEMPHLVAALYSRHGDGVAGLFEMKRVAECVMAGMQTCPAAARPFEHPARAANLIWQREQVGRIFELHPSLVEGRAAILDLDLRMVQSLSEFEIKYTPIRRYPSSGFDLSVVVGAREHAGTLQESIETFTGPLLESVVFLREYSGAPLEEGQKSVSFRVTVGSPERTLSSDEVGQIRERIIAGMREQGYELRV